MILELILCFFFFSSRRRHTRFDCDWSSDVCSSDLEHPRFLPLLEPLFQEVDKGRRVLVTSALTLLEVLVVPYRSGDRLLAERYEALLTASRGVEIAEISRVHLRAAAQLRAATGAKTPDALQLVAALGAGCGTLLTNDRELPAV